MGFAYLQVVDLDGAKDGSQSNQQSVQAICSSSTMSVQLGGGIRNSTTVARWHGITMQKVKVAAIVDISQEIVLLHRADTAPAHVWHRRSLTPWHFLCDSRDDTEAIGSVFFGVFGKQMHAQANSQNGLGEF